MSIGSRKAPLPIDFIIVGAGIAGLATAFALAQSGHRVRIFERRSGINQRAVGVRVPPNLCKILYEWGLQEELATATRCRKSAFHSIETGQVMGYLEWQEDVIQETGGEFLLMHYEDLYKLLYRLALSQGVTVHFNAHITSVSFDDEKELPSITLADGSIQYADLVIGADGYHSVVREAVTGEPDRGTDSGNTFFSIVIPAEKMKADPDWGKWLQASEWPMWMGDNRVILAYPIRQNTAYCVHAYWPETCIRGSPDDDESWDRVAPTNLIDFGNAHTSIKRLFNMVPDALRTKYIVRDIVEDWVDETGSMVLVGEAAHSLMPCTIHNLSLAVEDAAVFGVLMSHLRSRNQIPQLLEAFQDLRYSRVQQVQQSELNNATLVCLPPGDFRDMRDAGMALSLNPSTEPWDDARLREQWDEIGGVFGYNAREAAEDWWIKWGSLGDGTRGHDAHESFNLVFEVTEVAFSEN